MGVPISSLPFPADRIQKATDVGTAYDHLLGQEYYESDWGFEATGQPTAPNIRKRVPGGPRVLRLMKAAGTNYTRVAGVTGGVGLIDRRSDDGSTGVATDAKFGILLQVEADGYTVTTGVGAEDETERCYPSHEGICDKEILVGDYFFCVVKGHANVITEVDLLAANISKPLTANDGAGEDASLDLLTSAHVLAAQCWRVGWLKDSANISEGTLTSSMVAGVDVDPSWIMIDDA